MNGNYELRIKGNPSPSSFACPSPARGEGKYFFVFDSSFVIAVIVGSY